MGKVKIKTHSVYSMYYVFPCLSNSYSIYYLEDIFIISVRELRHEDFVTLKTTKVTSGEIKDWKLIIMSL